MHAGQLIKHAEGQFALQGELSFDTAVQLLAQGREALIGQTAVQVDLSAVTHADSAGLAVLLEWLRLARSQGQSLHYSSLPAQLQALARISDVDTLLV